MSTAAFWWLLFNLITIIILAFYSMMEMACVSFNNVRLQYYVTKGIKQAVWLNVLLHNPTKLFGTTLIGVNIATVVGSECSREFYSSLGFSPDWAPLSQVFLVVIFGELAPMFAARRYAEHVVMLGMPLLYASARLMSPFLYIVSLISQLCRFLIGGKESETQTFLTQEELVKIIENPDDEQTETDFQEIASNIFKLRHLKASDIMESLSQAKFLPSNATVQDMRSSLAKISSPFFLIYHRTISNIIHIAYPRDMIRASDKKRIRDYAKSPWFIPLSSSVMEILQQFRRNRQNVGIVINEKGAAVGLVTLDCLMNTVFNFEEDAVTSTEEEALQTQVVINKKLPGNMLVSEFNRQFGVVLDKRSELTLSELVEIELGYTPEAGDSIFISPYQLTVVDTTLTEVKEVSVSTKIV